MTERRSDQEVMRLLMDEKSPLNKARAQFSFAMARIEQAEQQRTPLTAVERRRMEFEAAEKILQAFLPFGSDAPPSPGASDAEISG